MPMPTQMLKKATKSDFKTAVNQAADVILQEAGLKKQTTFSPAYAIVMMKAISASTSMNRGIALARELRYAAFNWVRSYDDAQTFRQDWLVARNVLPLQVRLTVEQVLYDIGLGSLVTGFKPM